MPKTDVAAERAARLLEALRQAREQGDYPLTADRLRQRAEPEASDEELFKALAKAGPAVVVAAKKDIVSPVALAEDAEGLARGEGLLRYALGKLASAERPLHAPAKIVAQVDASLRPVFETALTERLTSGSLPAGVHKHEAKGKVSLYLDQFPPPPPPVPPIEGLKQQLLAALESARGAGDYPLRFEQLVARLATEPAPKLLKSALAGLSGQLLQSMPGQSDSLVVLRADRDRLLNDPRLLIWVIETARAPDDQLVPLAGLGKKLARELQDDFARSAEDRAREGLLPPGVGCLWTRKKPYLFLLADVGRWPPPAEEAPPPLPWESDFGRLFDAVYERLAREQPAEPVSLAQLRQEVPLGRETFNNELMRLWRAGRYTLRGTDQAPTLTPEERAAGIEQDGGLLLYVTREEA